MIGFRDLKVWQKAHALTLAVYVATRKFPGDERYGLTSQIRPSAASISANIAEGCGRRGGADFARFPHIALGPASELEYHLLLAADLTLIPKDAHRSLAHSVVEVKRMLTGFIAKLTSDV